MTEKSGLDALAREVRQRRTQLRASIDEMSRAAGMSPVTWIRVEKAEPVRTLTHRGVERALGWATGAIDTILAGGEPSLDREEPPDLIPPEDRAIMRDPLIVKILASPLPDETKTDLIHMVLKARRRADEGSAEYIDAQINMWESLHQQRSA